MLYRTDLFLSIHQKSNGFVVEQNCPYPELAGKDTHEHTRHVMACAGDRILAGYLRILEPGISHIGPSFGRVVVNKDLKPVRGGSPTPYCEGVENYNFSCERLASGID